MGDDGKGQEIVRSVVALARALGKSLVAEGIETEAQLLMLRELRCDEGQGYYFSRPLAPAQIDPLFVTWRDAMQVKRVVLISDDAPIESQRIAPKTGRSREPHALPARARFSETVA